jgi:hypothetical protein
MGPAVDSRIKTLDVGIPLLQIEPKLGQFNITHQLNDVLATINIL